MSTTDQIRTALITGSSSGIGKALATYLVSKNKKVILAGRTESSLQKTAEELGSNATYYVLDTGKISAIKSFTEKVVKEHPDLNCLINNAGVQKPFEFPGSGGKDYGFDLDSADGEIDINIRGPMHLVVNLLPHLTSLPDNVPGVIINVTSVLGFVPGSVINPVYNGTKAWLHSFTTNLRTQFEMHGNGKKLKVVELVPPQVATDLHRDRVDPDDNKKGKSKVTLSLEEFMDDVKKGLESGDDIVSAGPGKDIVKVWEESLGAKYKEGTSK